MDFIVVCPHCGGYIGINEYTYSDIELYFIGNNFMINGEIYCPECGKFSILDVDLEPCKYNVSKMEEDS